MLGDENLCETSFSREERTSAYMLVAEMKSLRIDHHVPFNKKI